MIDVCRSNLGATPGLIAVLHAWNQIFEHHPHIHCIVTGGGLSQHGKRWIGSRPNYFGRVRNYVNNPVRSTDRRGNGGP